MAAPASAHPSAAAKRAERPIILVPLTVEKVACGEVTFLLPPDRLEMRVDGAAILKALDGWAKPEVINTLKASVGADGNLRWQRLREIGLEVASRTITISARVAELAELDLVNSGESFVPQAVTKALDFGTLTEGKSLGFDLCVRSNAGCQVTLESESGGRLKHSSPSDPSQVPYTVSLGGSRVDLSRNYAVGRASCLSLISSGTAFLDGFRCS
jgi:hypothetical protein